jgi:hypothetical protein
MANNKRFVSPGVFTSEKDLTFVAQQVGVTTLGVVGETLKGPAFEPIFINNYNEYKNIFGGTSAKIFNNGKPQYEASYIAKQYLKESNQLFVTRVLGLTGYDAGKAWVLKAEANYNPETISATTTTTFSFDFSGTSIDDLTITTINDANAENLINLFGGVESLITTPTYELPGTSAAYPDGIVFEKVGTTFTGSSLTGTVVYDSSSFSGTGSGTVITYTADQYTEFDGLVLGMIRSRGRQFPSELQFTTTTLNGDFSSAQTDINEVFTLSATTQGGVIEYDCTLDTRLASYLPRVIGSTPNDRDTAIWLEEIYPNMIRDYVSKGYLLGIKGLEEYVDDFANYKQKYQTPETPWLVSELRGNEVVKLFKFISISDGNTANKEIKISVQRINLEDRTFDIVVRDFNDTDARPEILERFSRCSLNPSENNFIGERIGTADGEYPLRSRYVMLVLNPDAPIDAFPAGFEGYRVRDYDSGTVAPTVLYKKEYNIVQDKVRKTYLGISNTVGIDQNIFNWKGLRVDGTSEFMWTATTKGFHLDSGAEIAGDFEVGADSFTDVITVTNPDNNNIYRDINTRKFTLVPYLGFDGWNVWREKTQTPRTNTDTYKVGQSGFQIGLNENEFQLITQTEGTSDYYAFLKGIRTFENPEAININLFTTPGLDYVTNLSLVEETIEMIEEERSDSIYIVTSPERTTVDTTIDLTNLGFGTTTVLQPEDIADLLDSTGLDSNYTATYWPWIQMKDTENNVNIFLPPTLEVVRDLALTDNVSFPWFATAGYSRGRTQAIQPRIKLTETDRDILSEVGINPMTFFADEGTLIWGNKNLQKRDSLLQSLNIRRLLLQTRKLISAVAVRLLFEQNDQVVRNQFLNLVNPILENIKRERGISDFRIQLSTDPEDFDRKELNGKIFIKPIGALEFIDLEFNVTPTGASFDDL